MKPEVHANVPSTVAVMIAAYNAETTIARAVRSALAEPEVSEVWVIDDVSSDDTANVALQADDGTSRLKVLRQEVNGGPAAARNRALALCTAKWVCVLDSDDYFLPGRIGRLLAVSGDVEMIADELIRVTLDEEPEALTPDPQVGALTEIDLASFIAGNISRRGQYRQELGFIKPLMDRGFLAKNSLAYDTGLRLGEDYHLYARVLAAGGKLRLAGPLGYVAVTREDSLSGRHSIDDLLALRNSDRNLMQLDGLSQEARSALQRHYLGIDQRLQWRRLIEAVKSHDVAGAISTLTSAQVAGYLAVQLAEQGWLRTVGRLRTPS
ncbi:glycosyltransferase family 2 protein [Brevundimonas variabilis]|uniref:Succinoglycan biosynthesis protein ExoU n=1 Tax=Brevundimonas variabilis TaxID=74312 RepID=A0A7W9CIN1_9CAUL|nr:glycosyltransferase family 2 protein [Brevundimonas variabilis]MBB5746347.1 succinoglycan biosynthesis protein ExoU [Brevundimonas variabilis]